MSQRPEPRHFGAVWGAGGSGSLRSHLIVKISPSKVRAGHPWANPFRIIDIRCIW